MGSLAPQHPHQGVPVLESGCPARDASLLAHWKALCATRGRGMCHARYPSWM